LHLNHTAQREVGEAVLTAEAQGADACTIADHETFRHIHGEGADGGNQAMSPELTKDRRPFRSR